MAHCAPAAILMAEALKLTPRATAATQQRLREPQLGRERLPSLGAQQRLPLRALPGTGRVRKHR